MIRDDRNNELKSTTKIKELILVSIKITTISFRGKITNILTQ